MPDVDNRHPARIGILLASFALFPITIFYFSPYLIVWGAFQGVVAGSAIAFGLQLASAILLRRAFCGWACPAGGLQELEAQTVSKPCKLGKRILVKWVIWMPWVASIAAGFIVAGGVSYVDFLFHIDGGISASSPGAMMIYLIIVALFSIPNVFLGRRAMCHCICWMAPFMIIGEKLGAAIHAPQLHVATKPNKCVSCGFCEKACPMNLPVSDLVKSGAITHSECIQCAACCDACRKDALKLEFGQLPKGGADDPRNAAADTAIVSRVRRVKPVRICDRPADRAYRGIAAAHVGREQPPYYTRCAVGRRDLRGMPQRGQPRHWQHRAHQSHAIAHRDRRG